jgi:hypothetical protein
VRGRREISQASESDPSASRDRRRPTLERPRKRAAEPPPTPFACRVPSPVRRSGKAAWQFTAALRPAKEGRRGLLRTDDVIMEHGVAEAEVAFLAKPFSPAALTLKVREVLDQ